MSRFFRSASSSSSSSSSGEPLDNEEDVTPVESSLSEPAGKAMQASVDGTNAGNIERALTALSLPLSSSGKDHRDILLHALLEERSMRQVRVEHAGEPDSAAVKVFARFHYRELCRQLASYGLVGPGLDGDLYSSTRQRYRDGLDVLSQNISRRPGLGATAPGAPLMLTDAQGSQTSMANNPKGFQLPHQPQSFRLPSFPGLPINFEDRLAHQAGALEGMVPAPALFSMTRYQKDFEEVSMLGRGGYGAVYHCKHRLDGVSYAVKKVPLSMSRLRRIQDCGRVEVDELLLELTTLARLEHPNIVRYFSGWVDWALLGTQDALHGVEGPSHGVNLNSDGLAGASDHPSDSSPSFDRFEEVPEDQFISFERSTSRQTVGSGASQESSASGETLSRRPSRNTQATVSDEEVESIARSASDFLDHSTISTHINNPGPCLALHIQMSLYPLTLAEYLLPPASSDSRFSLRHCFHVQPSVHILLSLIDGVAYLHSQGVIHRDIKPANIFLAPHSHTTQRTSPADTFLCHQCRTEGKPPPEALKVRIGDFGLVAALAHCDYGSVTSPVGTELYRPNDLSKGNGLEALDWYALGVIAFELLCPFQTRKLHPCCHPRLSAFSPDIEILLHRSSDGLFQIFRLLLHMYM